MPCLWINNVLLLPTAITHHGSQGEASRICLTPSWRHYLELWEKKILKDMHSLKRKTTGHPKWGRPTLGESLLFHGLKIKTQQGLIWGKMLGLDLDLALKRPVESACFSSSELISWPHLLLSMKYKVKHRSWFWVFLPEGKLWCFLPPNAKVL